MTYLNILVDTVRLFADDICLYIIVDLPEKTVWILNVDLDSWGLFRFHLITQHVRRLPCNDVDSHSC